MRKLKDNSTVIEKIEFYTIRSNRKIDDEMMVEIDEYLTDGMSSADLDNTIKPRKCISKCNFVGVENWREEYFYNNLIDEESHTINIFLGDD